jgi:hypothetical protein
MTKLQARWALTESKAAYQEAITDGDDHADALDCVLVEHEARILFLLHERLSDDDFDP